ncbi:hypothetical protein [Paraburkholderia dilworthii]|uniref:hypothetical protein n=1 Tax=Paraburkholderia dilworthii TaxID=948106 RepID=UPI0004818D55|nr:hypothetical protein [Paraburkholderia dilworthii]
MATEGISKKQEFNASILPAASSKGAQALEKDLLKSAAYENEKHSHSARTEATRENYREFSCINEKAAFRTVRGLS